MPSLIPRRPLGLLGLLCLALGGAPASADADLEIGGTSLPAHAVLAGRQLTLNGAGVRHLLGFRIYVAALYLARPTDDAAAILAPDQPRRLELTLLFDTTTSQHIEALKGGLVANNSAAELQAIGPEVDRFMSLLGQVGEIPSGTVVLFDYLPGQGTHIQVGPHDLGVIEGDRFNRDVMKIWLGDDPIQLSLKQALLGQHRS